MERMSACAILLAVPLTLGSSGVLAGVGQGDLELGVTIVLSKSETTIDTGAGEFTTDSESGSIAVNGGFFVLDFLELKGALSAFSTDTFTTGVLSFGPDFVFLGRRAVAPFVGVAYGLSVGDADKVDATESDYVDGHAGVKFFLNERSSLEVKLQRFEPTDSKSTGGRTELAAGINVYF